MGKAYRARCIVLSKTKLGETDVICTLLADDGRQIRAVAKGLRRPGNRIGARLEPFSVVDLLLHPGKSLDVVGEVRCVATNTDVRDGLERTGAAAVIAEFLEKLTRDGALVGERVFPLTQTALAALGQATLGQAGCIAAAHLFKAMAMQGLRPATRECALCGAELALADRGDGGAGCETGVDAAAMQMAAFDVCAGGALCAACAGAARGLNAEPELVAWVDVLLGSTFEQLLSIEMTPSRALLELADAWMHEHLSLNLKSMAFLRTLV